MTAILNLETHIEAHVTVAELAQYWHVSERTVYWWISKGALKASRVGRSLRVKTEDAQAFGRPDEIVSGPVASA